MKTLKCGLRISKYTSSNREPSVTVKVHDEDSGIVLCNLNLTLAEFAEAITGLSLMDVAGESWANDPRLGTKRRTEVRDVFCPLISYDKQDYIDWLKENVELKSGETSSFYLGAHSSISRRKDGAILRYIVQSWPEQ